MENIRLFISLPFQRDGLAQDYPDCIQRFRAAEMNCYLKALQEEIRSAAFGMEDCAVSELVFGTGSYCHFPPEDLEELFALIGRCFQLRRDLAVTVQAAPRGFDFFQLTCARHLNEALIRFLTPCLDDERLREIGFCASEEILNALDVCFQSGYRRFVCRVSTRCHENAGALRATLEGLRARSPAAIEFDAPPEAELRLTAAEVLGKGYLETASGWLRADYQPVFDPAIDQIGCGLAAVTRFGDTRVKTTSDLNFYCEHAEDFEALVHPC